MNPTDRNAIASTPAGMPGPRSTTSMSAQMIELTERDVTSNRIAIGRT
ncbi:uncharacterized protein METZ01_LOCUS12263 [marine metagenome]|uniref:Uncharacterized protein n=1 Tax=marine metagenome TaxID=408172 RepID=A0A381NYZ8_9ZZZZ